MVTVFSHSKLFVKMVRGLFSVSREPALKLRRKPKRKKPKHGDSVVSSVYPFDCARLVGFRASAQRPGILDSAPTSRAVTLPAPNELHTSYAECP